MGCRSSKLDMEHSGDDAYMTPFAGDADSIEPELSPEVRRALLPSTWRSALAYRHGSRIRTLCGAHGAAAQALESPWM
jgi:hypothetical protein